MNGPKLNDDQTRVVTEPIDHHDPLGRRDYLSIEHLERYRFACRRLEDGPRVLDLACGAGYGTAMLATAGCNPTGVDCDPQTVAIAREGFPSGDFECADARRLPFADASFDAVVTFETIEHVADGEQYLREMWRVLRVGGVLICSTPNIAYTAHPAFHVKEYQPAEFYELVDRVFQNCERMAQYVGPIDRARDLYRWHLKPKLLGVADAIGLRPAVRRLRKRGTDGGPQIQISHERKLSGLRDYLAAPAHGDHAVRRWNGDRLLRIMIAVAERREDGQ